MKLFTLILIFSISAAISANNMEERSFKVKPGGTLNIRLNSSDVTINTWNRNEVQVTSQDENDLKITETSNTVNITPSGYSGTSYLHINIPESFNIKFFNTAGDLKINGNIKGDAEIKIQGGDVSFNDIYGNVILNTGGGNIHGNNINGGVEVNSIGGDITLGVVKGKTLIETGGGNIRLNGTDKIERLETSGGNIMVKSAAGNGEIYTGGGNIEIGNCSGNLNLQSMGGDIRLDETKGRIEAKTGGGVIRIKSLKGSINAHTGSGDMAVGLTSETNKSEINTGNGNIKINVSSNFRGKIIAQAYDPEWWKDEQGNNESIRSDFKVSSLKRNKREQQIETVYDINNGNTQVRIQASHGTITIRKN